MTAQLLIAFAVVDLVCIVAGLVVAGAPNVDDDAALAWIEAQA
jgi:hypothetical protein